MLLDPGSVVTFYITTVTQFLVSIAEENHQIHYRGFVTHIHLRTTIQIM
jgi:hypothetical protein